MQSGTNVLEQLDDLEERLEKFAANPDAIFGTKEIAKVWGLPTHRMQHLLENGHVKSARKIGARWCASRRELLRELVIGAEA